MRPMLLAFLATGVIAVGAWYGLNQAGFSAADQQSSGSVRLP
ncbi:MAG: hypothetical protein AAFQ66_17810 [Pseudomonadota bacterium]